MAECDKAPVRRDCFGCDASVIAVFEPIDLPVVGPGCHAVTAVVEAEGREVLAEAAGDRLVAVCMEAGCMGPEESPAGAAELVNRYLNTV